jgi:alpha-L-rhamnosidase
VTQDAYEIEVASAPTFADADVAWRSGIVSDSRPFGARYAGPALTTRSRYWWRVRVIVGENASEWSAPTWFETGILDGEALSARWISAPAAGADDRRALYFRQSATVAAPVVRARAYVSALGWYRLFVNGQDITGQALVPRWTPFDESVEYQVYDITEAVATGTNVVGIAAADGRYRGALGWKLQDARYGDRIGILAELILEFADGSEQRISSDEAWKVGLGQSGRRIRSSASASI